MYQQIKKISVIEYISPGGVCIEIMTECLKQLEDMIKAIGLLLK